MSTEQQIDEQDMVLPGAGDDDDGTNIPSGMASPIPSALEKSSINAYLDDDQGLALMNVILQQMVDNFKKKPSEAETDASAYIEALEKAPHLIAQESDPLLFLRREGGDPKAASHRLVKYWKYRRDIFGPDLAFRSLMNGDALTPEARGNIFEKSDTLVLLPNDKQGRTVVGKNLMLRRPGTMSPSAGDQEKVKASRMQSSLFVLSVAALNPKTQTEGIVLLVNLSGKASLALPYVREFTKIIAEALPVKIHSRHMACVPPPGGRRLCTQDIIPAFDQAISSKLAMGTSEPPLDATYHIGDSPSELGSKLELCGFERDGLPECFGGTWDRKQFIDQVEKQLARDQDEKKEGMGNKLPNDSEREERISPLTENVEASPETDLETSALNQESPENSTDKPTMISLLDDMHVYVKCLVDDFKKDPEHAKVNAAAYIEALEKAPQLITEESDPLLFLRREDGNIEAASRRLLLYWTYRRQLVGAEKAYKSILSWEAMDEAFREGLTTEMACILPNDNYGRSVGAINFARRVHYDDNDFSHKALHLLYIFLLVSRNPKSQSEGMAFIIILANNTSLQLPHFRKFATIIDEALPVKMYSRHICCCPPLGARGIFMEYMIPSVDRATGRDILPDAIIHVEDSLSELAEKLEEHGLSKDNLPAAVGGSWEHGKYLEYIDEQLSQIAPQSATKLLKEKGRQTRETVEEQKHSVKLPAKNKAERQHVSVAGMKNANVQDDGGTKKRSVEERHVQLSKLKLQPCGIPLDDQYEGSFSNETLEKLDAAMEVNPAEIFDRGSTEEDRISFNRKRNAVYSKRKYYRKKLKVESLMSYKESLATENLSLKLENRRLEALYEKARQDVLSIETQKLLSTGVNQAGAFILGLGSIGGGAVGGVPLTASQFPGACQQPSTANFLPAQLAPFQPTALTDFPQAGLTTSWMQSKPVPQQQQQQQKQEQMRHNYQQAINENPQLPFTPNLSGVNLSLPVQQQPDLIRRLLALQQQQQQTLPNEDLLAQLLGMGNFRNHSSKQG